MPFPFRRPTPSPHHSPYFHRPSRAPSLRLQVPPCPHKDVVILVPADPHIGIHVVGVQEEGGGEKPEALANFGERELGEVPPRAQEGEERGGLKEGRGR